MKVKILALSAILAALLLLAGTTGTALAGGRDRGGYSRHERQPVVVHRVQPRVVHKQPKMAYGRIIPVYPYAYAYPRPVIVERAPACAPLRAGWGFSIRFGF